MQLVESAVDPFDLQAILLRPPAPASGGECAAPPAPLKELAGLPWDEGRSDCANLAAHAPKALNEAFLAQGHTPTALAPPPRPRTPRRRSVDLPSLPARAPNPTNPRPGATQARAAPGEVPAQALYAAPAQGGRASAPDPAPVALHVSPAPAFGLGLALPLPTELRAHTARDDVWPRWLASYLGGRPPWLPGCPRSLQFDVTDDSALAHDLEAAVESSLDAPHDDRFTQPDSAADEVQVLCHVELHHDLLHRLGVEAAGRREGCKTLRQRLGHAGIARAAFAALERPAAPRTLLELMRQGRADWRKKLSTLGRAATFDAVFAALQHSRGLQASLAGEAVRPTEGARPTRLLYVEGFDDAQLRLELAWVHERAVPWQLRDGGPLAGCHLAALRMRLDRGLFIGCGLSVSAATDVWLACNAAAQVEASV